MLLLEMFSDFSQLEVRLPKMVAAIVSFKEVKSQVKHKKEVAEVTEAWQWPR